MGIENEIIETTKKWYSINYFKILKRKISFLFSIGLKKKIFNINNPLRYHLSPFQAQQMIYHYALILLLLHFIV